MTKFLTIVGLLAVISTPAFAYDTGAGNKYPTKHISRSVARGSNAYAMAPGMTGRDRYSPSANGGGSDYYNYEVSHSYL